MSSHRGYAHLNHQIHRQAVCSEVLLAWFMTFKNVKILYVRYMSDNVRYMSDNVRYMSVKNLMCRCSIFCLQQSTTIYNNNIEGCMGHHHPSCCFISPFVPDIHAGRSPCLHRSKAPSQCWSQRLVSESLLCSTWILCCQANKMSKYICIYIC